MIFKEKTRSLPITSQMVTEAYKKVKANRGSAGVDEVSLVDFQKDLQQNLYKIWNRLSSGSYFPPGVKEVEIPKDNGKTRKLGIPTVGDRIAQQVIKSYLEPRLEEVFHEHSYGYRPLKSAHQAVEVVRQNVRNYAWVVDMDIKSFFDEVDHELMMKALDRHVEEKWAKMYIKRWLEASVERPSGEKYIKEGKGTPQGGVISPLLANLYLHYTLDKWLEIHCSNIPFVRYADDVILHCQSEEEAEQILAKVRKRLQACKLELNEDKTSIVYCQDYRRKKKDYRKKFDFLGFSFKPVSRRSKQGGHFLGYGLEMSRSSMNRVIRTWRELSIHNWTGSDLIRIARSLNPMIRGVLNYYGRYSKRKLEIVFRNLHFRIAKWLTNKYKRYNGSYRKAYLRLKQIIRSFPNLFYHWSIGYTHI